MVARIYCLTTRRHDRKVRLADVHDIAMSMPHVTLLRGPADNPIYQVGGKSFVFFRTPRPDATDPVTGQRYTDVIVFWVPTEFEEQALVGDPRSPFFTTSHFDGHPSVLLRTSRIAELSHQELVDLIQDEWMSRASEKDWRHRALWDFGPYRIPNG